MREKSVYCYCKLLFFRFARFSETRVHSDECFSATRALSRLVDPEFQESSRLRDNNITRGKKERCLSFDENYVILRESVTDVFLFLV